MTETQTDRIFAAGIYIISFFTVFIGPLVIWLLKKDSSKLVDYHGRQYFNFFITYFIYGIISTVLMLVLIGYLLGAIFGVAYIIFTIIAAVKAFEGEQYRIPFIIRIL